MPHPDIIKKFLEGRATEAEQQEMLEYLAGDPAGLTDLRAHIDGLWDPSKRSMLSVESDEEMLHNLRQRLYPQVVPAIQRSRIRKRALLLAAACLIPAAVILMTYLFRDRSQQVLAMAPASWSRLENTGNETIKHMLPDGSTIYLASHSRLTYAADFSKDRQLRLEGEAFFDIHPDRTHPFVLSTNNIRTTVLGTSFNVEAYPNEADIRVSLVSGKVMVEGRSEAAAQRMILSPGDLLSWQNGNGAAKMGSFEISDTAQWTKGYMIFKDILLVDALRRVAMRYGLRLQVASGIAEEHRRITTQLKDDPLDEMLHILPFITPYSYQIRDSVLLVDRK